MALTARAQLAGGMRFEVEVGSGHQVTLDADADDGGRNAGPGPMEIVLVGLAGCVGMTALAILRKKRQDVTGYELRLQGTQAAEHPHVFLQIAVEHIITGRNVDPVAAARDRAHRDALLSGQRHAGQDGHHQTQLPHRRGQGITSHADTGSMPGRFL